MTVEVSCGPPDAKPRETQHITIVCRGALGLHSPRTTAANGTIISVSNGPTTPSRRKTGNDNKKETNVTAETETEPADAAYVIPAGTNVVEAIGRVIVAAQQRAHREPSRVRNANRLPGWH